MRKQSILRHAAPRRLGTVCALSINGLQKLFVLELSDSEDIDFRHSRRMVADANGAANSVEQLGGLRHKAFSDSSRAAVVRLLAI